MAGAAWPALRIKARDIESVRARARAHIASRPRPRVLFDERRGTQRSEFNRSTFFWCCIAKTVRNMSQIMRLKGMSTVWHNSTCEAVALCVRSCLCIEKESAVNCR